MKQKTQQCPDNKTLQEYVLEQIDERRELKILAHVDQCETCRQRLEGIAVGDLNWGRIQNHLQHETTRFEFQRPAEDEQLEFDKEEDRDLAKLQELLGPTDNPEMLGRIGSYDVIGLVGRGSTGIVVKAYDPRLDRYVAIKILSPNYANAGPARRRFERESRAVAAVAHEHVVPIYSVSEYRSLPFIVMQYVSGGSLQTRIDQNGPLSTCEVVRIGMQIAKGLAAAHAQGIVHRDVKPANVMLEPQVDRAMVSDFGLARVADDATLTRSGVVAGTPQFMSPEQACGEPVDGRSDLFSLGSTLYAACTGRPPFRADTIFGVIKKVCESQPVSIRDINPDIDPVIVSLIEKLLCKNPAERFSSAAEVAEVLSEELSHLQSPTVIPRPKREWLVRSRQLNSNFSKRPKRWFAIAGISVGMLLLAFCWPAISSWFGPNSEPQKNELKSTAHGNSSGKKFPQENDASKRQQALYKIEQNKKNRLADRLAAEGFKQFRSSTLKKIKVIPGGSIQLTADLVDIKLKTGKVDQVTFSWTRSTMARNQLEADQWLQKPEITIKEGDRSTQPPQQAALNLQWSEPNRKQFEEKIFSDLDKTLFDLLKEQKKSLLEIVIPENLSVDISTQRGQINCDSLGANGKFFSGNGNCVVKNVRGKLTARTQKGFIQFKDVDGSATIHSGGQVVGGNVGGSFYADARGRVHVGRCSKNVEVVTTGGDIKIERCMGPTEVRTEGGAIVIGSSHASVDATTGGGMIDIIFDGQPNKDSKLHTESGPIKIEIDPRLSLKILASAKTGSVASEFAPAASGKKDEFTRHVYVVNDGKHLIQATTGAGSVEIKKLKAENKR